MKDDFIKTDTEWEHREEAKRLEPFEDELPETHDEEDWE